MYQTIILSIENNIATFILNRPQANNSFNEQMFREVPQAIEQCECDENVSVIIITGAGKHFSSGGDIKEMTTFQFLTYDLAMLAGQMTVSVKKCTKPVIAMINGSAAGAGCALALACDFRIMTVKGALLTAFSNVGLSGDSGCIYHLYHIVGLAKTIELMAFSEPIKGEEALKIGLATKVVVEEQLNDEVQNLAEKLKGRPLAALAMQKKIYYDTFYNNYDTYCRLEAEQFVKTSQTEDHVEAITAFMEKRKPIFKGK